MVGVGEASSSDSREAGAAAASAARASLNGATPGWVLAFGGGRHDGAALLDGIRSILPDVPIAGGSAAGTIGAEGVRTTGWECSVAVFPDSLGEACLTTLEGLGGREHEVGVQLGGALRERAPAGATVLLFYDSVREPGPPPVLHVGSRLIEGMHAGLDGHPLHIAGAGTLCDLDLTDSWVFCGDRATKHAVTALTLPPAVGGLTGVMHGCQPIGSFLEITRIEGAEVYELDGRPAVDVIAERLGIEHDDILADSGSLALTLGCKHGDPFAPFDESLYVNRMVVAATPTTGSVTLFEADFEVGTRVQLMVTDVDRMSSSAAAQMDALLAQLDTREPLFALYIDCAGRSPAFCGVDVAEAEVVRERLEGVGPLLGFFSGVEIAPLMGLARPLDWTGVLCLLTHESGVTPIRTAA